MVDNPIKLLVIYAPKFVSFAYAFDIPCLFTSVSAWYKLKDDAVFLQDQV